MDLTALLDMPLWQILLGIVVILAVIVVMAKADKKWYYIIPFGLIGVGIVAAMIYMMPIPSILIIVVILVLFFRFRVFKPDGYVKEGIDLVLVAANSNSDGRTFTRKDVLRVVKNTPAFNSEYRKLRSNAERMVYLKKNAPAIAEVMLRNH